jgi:flagellar basal-body rod modification protein FlgD
MSDSLSIPGIDPGRNVMATARARFGDNPFLNLLVTQMRTQTPMDPVDNESFMQQMAQFSAMEEQRQINDNLLQLLDFQGVLARLQGLGEGSALLGREVTFALEGKDVTGIVDSVYVAEDGEVRAKVSSEAGERDIALRQIKAIRNAKED